MNHSGVQFLGKWLIVLGLLGLPVGLVMSGQSQPPEETAAAEVLTCRVLRVYDGDTFGCDLNGDGRISKPDEHIRLWGIDAPEMHYSRKNKSGRDEPYAREATQLIETMTKNKTVTLRLAEQPMDKYGRRLAFAYVPGEKRSLNELTLAKGYAAVLFLRGQRQSKAAFEALEAQARAQRLGIWR